MDQLVCSNRTKDDGRKWKYKKQFKYKVKNHFSCQGDWTVEFFSSEIFKPNFPGCLPGDLAAADVSVVVVLEQTISGDPLWAQPFCASVTLCHPHRVPPQRNQLQWMHFANCSKSHLPPSQKTPSKQRQGAVTFCVIKIASLMEALMILNQETLTSLSTAKDIMDLKTSLLCLMFHPPPSLLLVEEDESFHLWITQYALFMEHFYQPY